MLKQQQSLISQTLLSQTNNQITGQYLIRVSCLSEASNKNQIYLILKQSQLVICSKYSNQRQDIRIKREDFIGFNQQEIGHKIVMIKLNAYVKKKKFMRQQRRYLQHHTFYVSYEQSIKQIEQLKLQLLYMAASQKLTSLQQLPKLMIYFNPNAGSNSKKHFDKVVDFLGHTNFSFDVVQTTKRNHCIQHINQSLMTSLGKYHGVVIISGDGLMHEFVNSKAVGKIPVTHVPAGSGNAFAKYQTQLAKERCEDQVAIYLAVKGRHKELNLIELNLQRIPQPIYSFLSFQWCYMADIDMNSEFLRFLGSLRFEIYGLWRLISMRKYRAKFSYSTTQTNLPLLDQPIQDNQHYKKQQKTYLHKIITFIPWVSEKYQISPLLHLQDESMDLQSISDETSRLKLAKYMLTFESGQQFNRQKQEIQQGYEFLDWAKIKSFRLQPNGADRGVFGIDGQKYDSQKIQGRISEKKVVTFV